MQIYTYTKDDVDMLSVDYEKLFLEFIETLTVANLDNISRSIEDIYWDFDQKEFFLFVHGSSPSWRCFKVFDAAWNKDFPGLEELKQHAEFMYDIFNYVQGAIDETEEKYAEDDE